MASDAIPAITERDDRRAALAVGSFVLVGLVLLVAALLVFGRVHLLSRSDRAVIFLSGSVGGLAPGSPVTFRGVRVGSVRSVSLHLSPGSGRSSIPVVLTLFPGRVVLDAPAGGVERLDLARQVRAGLRGELVTQSLVTGQMAIDLEMRPEVPAVLHGHDEGMVEIPFVQSDLERLKQEIPKVPLEALSRGGLDALHSVTALADMLNSRLPPLLDRAQGTLDGMEPLAPAVLASVTQLRNEASLVLAHYDRLSAEARALIAARGPELKRTLADADAAANEARRLLSNANQLAAPDSETRLNLEAALRDAAAATDSLRGLARDLERDPSLALRGRGR
ncbi:MlaD family protein [Rhizosaccharibacter radicis]|uniref:MlaD family protein n=1 Tax=Rhizosaccharibacter radicis TaxID=2782605 RepID=A0ABT1W3E8_9PROT|nr:MlaD family protein [Acetobacteraceae bacterium KSS12]